MPVQTSARLSVCVVFPIVAIISNFIIKLSHIRLSYCGLCRTAEYTIANIFAESNIRIKQSDMLCSLYWVDRWVSYLFHSTLDSRNLLSCITQNGLTFGFQRNRLLMKADWQPLIHKFLSRRLSQLLFWVENTWYLLLPIFHPNPAAGTSWLTSMPIHSCSSSKPFPIKTVTQKL